LKSGSVFLVFVTMASVVPGMKIFCLAFLEQGFDPKIIEPLYLGLGVFATIWFGFSEVYKAIKEGIK
jgi:hypothetical protein